MISEDAAQNGNDTGIQTGENGSDAVDAGGKPTSDRDEVPDLGFDSRFKYPNV